jgi:uncharacterized integral membrane protein (TIGR00697 family)
MFKDIDKSMMLKLALLHVLVITVSNALVSIPVEIAGIKLTWAAFTFPLVVLATDLTVRMLGKGIARATIAAAYPFAIIGSILVVLAEGAPSSVALRIGFASATAYAIGTLLDVYVFQWIRENMTKQWWAAPAISTIAANIIDTYSFFFVAFSNSADEYMAANWAEIAGSQTVLKIIVGLVVFLPAYGVLLRYLNGALADQTPVVEPVVEPVLEVVTAKPAAIKTTKTAPKKATSAKKTPTKRGRKPKPKVE